MAAATEQDVFHAVADPTRRKLLRLLAEEEELPVTEISGHFSMSRRAVSKHLRVLSRSGLVEDRKIGRETRYRLRPEPLFELRDWLAYYERFWDRKMGALKALVEEEKK